MKAYVLVKRIVNLLNKLKLEILKVKYGRYILETDMFRMKNVQPPDLLFLLSIQWI